MDSIENKTFDEERALYNQKDARIAKCAFAGPRDGESVLKESRNIVVEDCLFSLRYPLWHADNYVLRRCRLDEKSRAPLWYSNHGRMEGDIIHSVKALRGCQDVKIYGSTIDSEGFGWKCRYIAMENSTLRSEYAFLDATDVELKNVRFEGKYAFQYMKNLHITNSHLTTKDVFWHSRNVIVEDSVIDGEYAGWYSEGLTLIRCTIKGTQPFCYCKRLKLIDCTMIGTDLSFEYSDVHATIKGKILSVKNPKSGKIVADEIGKIIRKDSLVEDNCMIETRRKNHG